MTLLKVATTFVCVDNGGDDDDDNGGGGTGSGGTCAVANEASTATLSCSNGQVIKSIEFASYGTPTGSCPNFSRSECHASGSANKVRDRCLNRQSCEVPANNGVFGDPCEGVPKKLVVRYSCGR